MYTPRNKDSKLLNQSLKSFEKQFNKENQQLKNNQIKLKKTNKIVLYDLPQIQSYKKINKPFLDQDKKNQILEKLEQEKASLYQFRQRQRTNDFFLNYGQNPFVNIEGKNPQQLGKYINGVKVKEDQQNMRKRKHSQNNFNEMDFFNKQLIQKQMKQKYSQLPNALSKLQLKPFKQEIYINQRQFHHKMNKCQMMSTKNLIQTENKQRFQFFNDRKINQKDVTIQILNIGNNLALNNKQQKKKLQNIIKENKNVRDKQNRPRKNTQTSTKDENQKQQAFHPLIESLPQNVLTFQQILKIEQQNYYYSQFSPYNRNHRPLDIFSIAFEKDNYKLIGKQVLIKDNFNFTSFLQKVKYFKIPIYRDISRLSRQVILNIKKTSQNIFDHVDSVDLGFKITQLRFQDLMSIASGRFNSQFIYKMLNSDMENINVTGGKEMSQTSSQKQLEQELLYPYDTNNKIINFFTDNEQHQIQAYLKIPPTNQQRIADQRYQKFNQLIKNNYKLKQYLLMQTIRDDKLHKQINSTIKNRIEQFLKLDLPIDSDIDKIIRFNRFKKDKNISLKFQRIIDLFNTKKQHQIVKLKAGIIQNSNIQVKQIPKIQNKPLKKIQIPSKITKSTIKLNQSKSQNKNLSQINAKQNTKQLSKSPLKKINNLNNLTINTCASPNNKTLMMKKIQPSTTKYGRISSQYTLTPQVEYYQLENRRNLSKTPRASGTPTINKNIQTTNKFVPTKILTTNHQQFQRKYLNQKQNKQFPNDRTQSSPFFRKKQNKLKNQQENTQKSHKILPSFVFSHNKGKNGYLNTFYKNKN